MTEVTSGDSLPVLPLRDIVVFPHMIVPLFVGRDKSVRALEAVMRDDKQILLVAQKNAAVEDPSSEDLYTVGTVSTVLQLLKLPDGTVKVLVEGSRRARITAFQPNQEYFEASAELMPEAPGEPKETEALARTVVSQFESYIKLNKKIAPEVLVSVNQIDDPAKLADTVAGHLPIIIYQVPSLVAHIKAGNLKALAVLSPRRTPLLPDVATPGEQGIKDFDATAWMGLFGPARLPPAVTDRLQRALADAVADPEVRAQLAQQGFTAVGSSPAEFRQFVATDIAKWAEVVKATGASID